MPNHVHLIWKAIKRNGKEKPHHSFLKFTSHSFKKYMVKFDVVELENYYNNTSDRKFNFWQRDPLAVKIFNQKTAFEKLNYIHKNPCHEKWMLSVVPEDYTYSSAKFYSTGKVEDSVILVTDIREVFFFFFFLVVGGDTDHGVNSSQSSYIFHLPQDHS
jgi:hypothetical protein